MARTKTISQNVAIIAGPAPATGISTHNSLTNALWAVTALDYSWSQNKNDVLHYGYLAPRERVATDPPEVTLDFSYYLHDGYNEDVLGFIMSGATSTVADFLNRTEDERNYFVFIAPEGQDAFSVNGASTGVEVLGIGNGFINSYSIEAAVGDFPTASIQVQGLNIRSYTGAVNQALPAVNPTTGLEITGSGTTFTIGALTTGSSVNVLRPGDIEVTLTNAGGLFHSYTNPAVQNFRMGFDFNRTALSQLGSRFSTSREIQFPVNINFEVSMFAKDLRTGSLATFLCETGLYNAEVRMKLPNCSGAGSGSFGFKLRNISLEGQQWSTSVGGDPQTLTTTWVGQIGASGDTTNGLLMSGRYVVGGAW